MRQFVESQIHKLATLLKVVDIDFLIDGVVKNIQRLDVEKIMTSRTTLYVALTRFEDGKEVLISNRDSDIDLYEALRATAALPVLYGKQVALGASNFIDGGVVDAVPLFEAVKLGCTDVVVVTTSPLERRRTGYKGLQRLIRRLFVSGYPRKMRELLLDEEKLFNATMQVLQFGNGQYNGTRYAVVYPSEMTKLVSRTTIDRSRLLDCVELGRRDMLKLLTNK